jgi:hypothetical protein
LTVPSVLMELSAAVRPTAVAGYRVILGFR